MRYNINHKTVYTYHEPVSLCHNVLRLFRGIRGGSCVKRLRCGFSPKPDTLQEYEDFFGNKVIYFSIEKEHRELTVSVHSQIEKVGGGAANPEDAEAGQFRFETPMTAGSEEISAYARVSFLPGRPVVEATTELMRRIYTDFIFSPGFTMVSTPLSVVMRERKGVSQDFAHLAIACIRSVGLPGALCERLY